jgi:predicted phage tail protein
VRARATVGGALTAAPGNLNASASGNSVTLTWVSPGGTAVSSYIIEAGSSPGLANLANFSTGNVQTSFSTTGVTAGNYYVRVRAIGVSGDISTTSNEALLIVGSGPCTGAPGAPSALSTVSVNAGTVALAWNAAAGSPTSYVVEAGSGPGQVNLANGDVGLTTSLTATGVAAGTYYVRIRARNSCGVGSPSNEITLVVGSPAPPGPAPGPGSLFTMSGTGDAVFDMPTTVSRIHIVATSTGDCKNFQVSIGGRLIANVIMGNCIIGVGPRYEATVSTIGGVVDIVRSNGVAWSFTEVR